MGISFFFFYCGARIIPDAVGGLPESTWAFERSLASSPTWLCSAEESAAFCERSSSTACRARVGVGVRGEGEG